MLDERDHLRPPFARWMPPIGPQSAMHPDRRWDGHRNAAAGEIFWNLRGRCRRMGRSPDVTRQCDAPLSAALFGSLALHPFLNGFRWCLLPFGQKATFFELGEDRSRMAPVPTFDE